MHLFRFSRTFGVILGIALVGTVDLPGQGFDSGSDGSDGALTFAPNAGARRQAV